MELKNCKFESISKVNFDTIIDVRSPKEFTEDHIPNSINLQYYQILKEKL